jgi:hypothetical protein
MKVCTPVSGLFEGYALLNMEVEPSLTWKGGPVPFPLWGQMMTFFREVYAQHKAEATLRLFYHEAKQIWAAEVFEQQVSAASAKETGDPTKTVEYMTLMAAGWCQFGTIHSHASMNAFQSGTDKHDEANSPGLHVTVGNLDKLLTFDCRLVFKGVQYTTALTDWVQVPEPAFMNAMPDELRDEFLRVYIAHVLPRAQSSPQDVAGWLARVKTWTTGNVGGGVYGGNHECRWPRSRHSWGDEYAEITEGGAEVAAPVPFVPTAGATSAEIAEDWAQACGDLVQVVDRYPDTLGELVPAVFRAWADNWLPLKHGNAGAEAANEVIENFMTGIGLEDDETAGVLEEFSVAWDEVMFFISDLTPGVEQTEAMEDLEERCAAVLKVPA